MPNPIHIIFDKLPGPDAPQFIEVEDGSGNSISVGEWREREDGTAELVIPVYNGDRPGYLSDIAWRIAVEMEAQASLGTTTVTKAEAICDILAEYVPPASNEERGHD